MKQIYIISLFTFFFCLKSFAQSSNYWLPIPENSFVKNTTQQTLPTRYKMFQLDTLVIQEELARTPLEYNTKQIKHELMLPMPDGSVEKFNIVESSIMETGLAIKFPEIRTYLGQGIDNPSASVKLSWTHKGFRAMIISAQGKVFIDPYRMDDKAHYISYYKKDFQSNQHLNCSTNELSLDQSIQKEIPFYQKNNKSSGEELQVYKMAISCTAEYANFHGGTLNSVMSELVILMNRVNGIYETELGIRMILVSNNDQLIYFDASTDPFNNNNATQIINQNQSVIDNVIGNANYDIGHVVSTGGGGLAPGFACIAGTKAKGVTGLPSPVADPFYIDYVCHEIGHQFKAGHIFNGNSGNCKFGIWTGSAYEPGSGTTIMSYAGICSGQNIQNNSSDYFHTHSFDQIQQYITVEEGSNCGVTILTGNTEPVVNAGTSDFFIPKNTPFELIGMAVDADGDSLTYCWEQYDLGSQGAPNDPIGNAPLFRSFPPKNTSNRTFPQISDIVNNTQTMGEILPSYARDLKFRLTVRDNRAGGGGVNYDTVQFSIANNTDSFLVRLPNDGTEIWKEGRPAEITWDVANTNVSPVNATQVDILLSMDGGYTYPVTLATNVENTGSSTVFVPQGVATNTARVRIQASNSIFFDISNHDFMIIMDQNQFGIEDNNAWIFPNPVSSDYLNIVLRLAETQNIKLRVCDIVGQKLLKQKIVNGYSGSNDIELEINSFISGVYILLIEGNDFLIAEKIVIQKR